MKRRDFLKVSPAAGAGAAVPFSFASLTSCTNKPTADGNKTGISGKADTLVLGNIITIDNGTPFADAMTIKDMWARRRLSAGWKPCAN